jgi:hypothetical protein
MTAQRKEVNMNISTYAEGVAAAERYSLSDVKVSDPWAWAWMICPQIPTNQWSRGFAETLGL